MPRGVPKAYHSDSEESISEETDFGDSLSDSEEGWIKKKKPTAKKPAVATNKRKPVAKQSKSGPRKITKKKKVLKRKIMKPKKSAPKKPTSAFFIYRNATVPSIKATNPTSSFQEVTKIIATMWNGLSIAEREPYKLAAEVDKERYEKELATYTPSDDEDDDEEEEEDEEDSFDNQADEQFDDDEYGSEDYEKPLRRAAPKKRAKKEKKPGPKRPSNAYLIFVNAKRPEVLLQNPTWPITEAVRHLGALWKSMTDQDKTIYNELAARDKVRYERELREFSEQ
jgi:hypothetical protein